MGKYFNAFIGGNMTGIYKITNIVNGKCYVGQAVDIEKRLREHINDSFNPKRREYEYPLSRAYRKYGLESFKTEILEICLREELNKKEIFWIEHFNSKKEGYNQLDGGQTSPLNASGEKHHLAKLTDKEVFLIREEYNNHTPFEDVFNKYGKQMSESGFRKIWLGYTRKTVHYDVYTEENKQYWEYVKNISGNRLYSDKDVIDIRTRLKNGEDKNSIYQDYKGRTTHSSESFNDICSEKRYAHIKV